MVRTRNLQGLTRKLHSFFKKTSRWWQGLADHSKSGPDQYREWESRNLRSKKNCRGALMKCGMRGRDLRLDENRSLRGQKMVLESAKQQTECLSLWTKPPHYTKALKGHPKPRVNLTPDSVTLHIGLNVHSCTWGESRLPHTLDMWHDLLHVSWWDRWPVTSIVRLTLSYVGNS